MPVVDGHIPLRQPEMVDLGIAWLHDYPCPVCRERHAVLNMDIGVMEPCWDCQRTGWRVMMPWTWQRRWWDNVLRKRRKVQKWAAAVQRPSGQHTESTFTEEGQA